MSSRAPSQPSSAFTRRRRNPVPRSTFLCFPVVGACRIAFGLAISVACVWAAPASAEDAPAPLKLKKPKLLTTDDMEEAGYLPGYRQYSGLGMSPYTPLVPGLPGGFTPGFAAPMPQQDWTFTF